MLGIPPLPGSYLQAAVMELSTCDLYPADVYHGIQDKCQDGQDPVTFLHCINGCDQYFPKVWRRPHFTTTVMFLTSALSVRFIVLLFLPRVLEAIGKNATLPAAQTFGSSL